MYAKGMTTSDIEAHIKDIKKVIDRLSRNLNTFNEGEKLFEQYLYAVKSQIN